MKNWNRIEKKSFERCLWIQIEKLERVWKGNQKEEWGWARYSTSHKCLSVKIPRANLPFAFWLPLSYSHSLSHFLLYPHFDSWEILPVRRRNPSSNSYHQLFKSTASCMCMLLLSWGLRINHWLLPFRWWLSYQNKPNQIYKKTKCIRDGKRNG